MSGSCSAGQEGSLPEQKRWLSFLLGTVTIWAWAPMSRLPSDSKWAHSTFPSARFFWYFLVLALVWHNKGLYLWLILVLGYNCQRWGANHPLSNKRNEGLKAAHPTERRNYTRIRRFGAKGLLLMFSYWCSISSFQRQGRGNWCVKINCGCKKTICQTTCWLQSH